MPLSARRGTPSHQWKDLSCRSTVCVWRIRRSPDGRFSEPQLRVSSDQAPGYCNSSFQLSLQLVAHPNGQKCTTEAGQRSSIDACPEVLIVDCAKVCAE